MRTGPTIAVATFVSAMILNGSAFAQSETTRLFCRLQADRFQEMTLLMNNALQINTNLYRTATDISRLFESTASSRNNSHTDLPDSLRSALLASSENIANVGRALSLLASANDRSNTSLQRLAQEFRACANGAHSAEIAFQAARQQAASSISINLQALDMDDGRARQWVRLTNVGSSPRMSLGANCVFFDNGRPYAEAQVMEIGNFLPQQGVSVAVRAPSSGAASSVECQPR